MPQAPKLYFGPYETPRYRIGQSVLCERFGYVEIVGTSSGRIPWPLGRRPGTRARASLVLFGDLTKAVREETGVAVRYWWGAGVVAVDAMRKALEVSGFTAGTQQRQQEINQLPAVKAGRLKAWAKARDPERRRKIAEARKGKPRSPEVVAAMSRRMKGSRLTESTRAKMSEAHLKRGTRPPAAGPAWSAEDDELIRTLPPKAAAERTGRTLVAVYQRRNMLRSHSRS